MMTNLDKLKTELMTLPMKERAFLAKSLIESLDGYEDVDIDKLWEQELDNRYEDIKLGKVKCRDVEEVVLEARERLQRK
ncbi:MAG: addiction module protein [Acidobacteria bacterium]|nr:addiction module protein [Acidobacteriota bacterium]